MEKFGSCLLLRRLFFFFVYGATLFYSSNAADIINGTTSLRDGDTLLSAGGGFELGFFGLGGASRNKYLCLRSTRGPERPVVWVANRRRPLSYSTGVLRFQPDGNLAVIDGNGDVFWSTMLPSSASGDRAARLLDTGNLVVGEARDDLPTSPLWQSFDEPGDTLLPTMKLQVNSRTHASRHLTSWKSADDPSPGNYSYKLDISNSVPRLVLWDGSTIKYTTGLWNGIRFTGFPPMNANGVFNSTVVSSGDETYYTDSMIGNSSFLRVRLDPSGRIQRSVWRGETRTWSSLWMAPKYCEQFAICGSFGTCAEDVFPPCHCLRGFRPRFPEEWSVGQGTNGCVRTTNFSCGSGDTFQRLVQVKLPEMDNATVEMDMTLEGCREKCARDCSCTAFASADVREGGRGCITWSDTLMDMRNLSDNSQEFYLRVAASDADSVASVPEKRRSRQLAIVASISVTSAVFFLVLCGFGTRKLMSKSKTGGTGKIDNSKLVDGEDGELPLFDFETITSSTHNFSIDDKIGEGGFGVVYKAWKLWQEGNCLELLDHMVASSSHESELSRCMQVGLLCVQEHARDRPTMYEVVTMLSNDSSSLPRPKKPGFLVFRSPTSSSRNQESFTTNELTNTSILQGR
ncbi:hypothetical protein Taro_049242 [Colocasia esculenta]|uniref:Receptor-like serine/threonine-protein kinase n=1 Tax=Colocasia esculenta TaxID=4460 RepID=A0A843XAI6_COLES|nr:hypothetical protein [Colocasia esculenta]